MVVILLIMKIPFLENRSVFEWLTAANPLNQQLPRAFPRFNHHLQSECPEKPKSILPASTYWSFPHELKLTCSFHVLCFSSSVREGSVTELLSQRHKDLSLDPRTHIKSWTQPHAQQPHTEEVGLGLTDHRLPGLAACSLQFQWETLSQRNNVESDWGWHPTSTSHLYIPMHGDMCTGTCVCVHIHEYSPLMHA